MSLPRFALPEDDDDSTSPAEFLLKLPPSYERKLAALSTPNEWMLVPPVIAPSPPRAKPSRSPRLIAAIAGVAVAIAIIAGTVGALAQSSGGPVGISKRAPKKLEHVVRAPTRQSGVAAARVHAPAPAHATRHRASRKH